MHFLKFKLENIERLLTICKKKGYITKHDIIFFNSLISTLEGTTGYYDTCNDLKRAFMNIQYKQTP